jgi:cobalt-zinc-cadmium efflux system membrane fusion protein
MFWTLMPLSQRSGVLVKLIITILFMIAVNYDWTNVLAQDDSPGHEPHHRSSGDEHSGHDAQNEHDEHHGHQGVDDQVDHAEHEGRAEHDALVRLSAEDIKDFGIEIAEVGGGELAKSITLPAEIDFDPERVSHVSPRYIGIVESVHRNIGDQVSPGETLAVIEANASLASIKLKAGMKGIIVHRHIARGELVKESDQVFTIADLSKVWVNITVYQKDLPAVREGQDVVISTHLDIPSAKGKIFYVSPVVSEKTRTATAVVKLDNPQRAWKPGMFVKSKVTVGTMQVAMKVHRQALQKIDGQQVVFIKESNGFKPVPVQLGRKNHEYVEVTSGLEPGQLYVKQGAFTLKAEQGKSSLRGGHQH